MEKYHMTARGVLFLEQITVELQQGEQNAPLVRFCTYEDIEDISERKDDETIYIYDDEVIPIVPASSALLSALTKG